MWKSGTTSLLSPFRQNAPDFSRVRGVEQSEMPWLVAILFRNRFISQSPLE
jgi:hypothetical protein